MVNGTRSSRPARGGPLSLVPACERCVGRHWGAEPGLTLLSRPRRLPRGVRRGSAGSSDAAGTPRFRLLWLSPRGPPPSAAVGVLSRRPVVLPSRALHERWLCLGLLRCSWSAPGCPSGARGRAVVCRSHPQRPLLRSPPRCRRVGSCGSSLGVGRGGRVRRAPPPRGEGRRLVRRAHVPCLPSGG